MKPWVKVALTHICIIGAVAGILMLLSWAFGSACPLYAIFGICCPFCGMTRAHLAALRLDFAAAFTYHPAFFTGIPFLWMLCHKGLFEKKWAVRLWWMLTVVMGAALLGTYVARVILHGGFDFFA